MQALNTALLIGIFFLLIAALLTLWITNIHHKLQKMDECCRQEQYQAAVLEHSHLNAIHDLLEYAAQHGMTEAENLSKTLCADRIAEVRDMNSVELILNQGILAGQIMAQYQEHASDLILSPSDQAEYGKKLGAPPFFAQMLERNRTAHDAAVLNLNNELKRFPFGIVGKFMKIAPRKYLKNGEPKTDFVRKEN